MSFGSESAKKGDEAWYYTRLLIFDGVCVWVWVRLGSYLSIRACFVMDCMGLRCIWHFIIISLIIAAISGSIDYDSLYWQKGSESEVHEIEVRKFWIRKYCYVCIMCLTHTLIRLCICVRVCERQRKAYRVSIVIILTWLLSEREAYRAAKNYVNHDVNGCKSESKTSSKNTSSESHKKNPFNTITMCREIYDCICLCVRS